MFRDGVPIGACTGPSGSASPDPCVSAQASGGDEETVSAGGSGLSYEPASGRYVNVWKTRNAWRGSCRQLDVLLADGTHHRALFSFPR